MTLWVMLQLNSPPEEALAAVFSPVANKAVAVKPRLADALGTLRIHGPPMEKDSSEAISQEMGFFFF